MVFLIGVPINIVMLTKLIINLYIFETDFNDDYEQVEK